MRLRALLPPLALKLLFLVPAGVTTGLLNGVCQAAQTEAGELPTIAACVRNVAAGERLHLPPRKMGYLYVVLGSAYQDGGDFEHSRAAYERGVSLLQTDPTARGDFATALDDFGSLYLEFGQVQTARALRERAFKLRRERGVPLEIAFSQEHLAEVELASHRLRQAEALATAARASFGALSEEERRRAATASTELSALLTLVYAEGMRGHREASLRAAQDASRMAAGRFGEATKESAHVAMARGFAEWKAGRIAEADASLQEGLRLLRECAGEKSPQLLQAMYEYREFLRASGATAALAAIDERVTRMATEQRRGQCATCAVSVQALR